MQVRFGHDSDGDFGLQNLRDEGVDVTFAEQIKGAGTQIAFIMIDERNGERTVIWKRDELLHYSKDEAPFDIAGRGKVFHFTPHDMDACIVLAKIAKESGAVVSIDIDDVFIGLEDLLPYVDVLLSSSDFPDKFLGIRNKERSLKELKAKFGCKVVGITIGERGSLILCENQLIETRGFSVPEQCKDTTGAGDSFRSGFLYGLLSNESVEESARMANAVAALKCREVGARTALPNLMELRELLRVYPDIA